MMPQSSIHYTNLLVWQKSRAILLRYYLLIDVKNLSLLGNHKEIIKVNYFVAYEFR